MVGHTFRDVVPPGCVERVIGTPARDIRAVRLASAVLERESRSDFGLVIQAWEGVHVGEPPVNELDEE